MNLFKINNQSVFLLMVLLVGWSLSSCTAQNENKPKETIKPAFKITHTEQEWKEMLSPMQFYVLRESGTERAFTGEYWDNHDKGKYACAGCQSPLFSSNTKFESGTGWPSYYQPISDSCILEIKDQSLGMTRIEVRCAVCNGHLGHVFNDGPKPTGLRYCINSAALEFYKE